MKKSLSASLVSIASGLYLIANAAQALGDDAQNYILRQAPFKKTPQSAVYDLKKPVSAGGTLGDRLGSHISIVCGSAPTLSLTRKYNHLSTGSGELKITGLRFETKRSKGKDTTKATLFFVPPFVGSIQDHKVIDKAATAAPPIDQVCSADGKVLPITRDQAFAWQAKMDAALKFYLSTIRKHDLY